MKVGNKKYIKAAKALKKAVAKAVIRASKKVSKETPKLARRSRKNFVKLVKRNPRETVAIFLLFTILLGSMGNFSGNQALGATYAFNQSNWSGGATANNAGHPTNQSGWTQFSTSSQVIASASAITLTTSTASITQTDDTNSNTGFNLTGFTNSQTAISGTGNGASVTLAIQSTNVLTTSTLVGPTSTSPGAINSMVMGQDGFARIVYNASANNSSSIKFIRCANLDCSSKVETTLGPWIGNVTNERVSIAMGSDGYARIAHANYNTRILRYVQCTNDDCSTKVVTEVDSGFTSTNGLSMVLGADGFGRIAFGRESNLKFIQCANESCSVNTSSTVATSMYKPSLTIGSDGFGRILSLYLGTTPYPLRFYQCTNADCSVSVFSTIAADNTLSGMSGVKLGTDGFVRISYNLNGLQFVQCTNAACSTRATSTVDAAGGEYSSIAINQTTGLPSISYLTSTGIAKIAACTNASCSINTKTTLDTGITVYNPSVTSIALDSNGYARMVYSNQPSAFLFAYPANLYFSSGTYTSGAINSSSSAWGTLSWTSSGTGTITMKARSSATSDFSAATAWSSCSNITTGAALATGGCVTNGQPYIQYQASLSTSNATVTPSLDSVSIGYVGYTSSGNLISSAYNSADPTNVIGGLSWAEDTSLPAGTAVTVSLRTASSSAGLSSASWTDFMNNTPNCSKATGTVTCTNSAIPAGMKDGTGDEWLQYKVTFTSDGSATPTVSGVTVTYVVNAPPQFNPDYNSGSSLAQQISSSTDPNWGRVAISYSIRDPDSPTGTNTPGYVTPSFEYNTGSGWVAISSSSLNASDYANKAVDQTIYSTYSATWNAATQIPNVYSANTSIRVKANDNEAANNIASSTTGTFVLDTKMPVSSNLNVNGATDVFTFSILDDTNLEYRVSTDINFSGVGWVLANATSVSATTTSPSSGGISEETVYLQIRDAYGNTTTSQAVVPAGLQNLDLRDTSNLATQEYRQFLSWRLYTGGSQTQFSKYEVYRSTDNVNFNILANVTNINQNYYTDTDVSSSSTYYYKVAVVDTNEDRSGFSSVLSDKPDGQGGTDFTPPVISGVQTAEIQTTWAKITWNTDEVSDSKVEFSSTSGDYSLNTTNISFVTNHSVVLRDLSASTTYYYRVKSKDIMNNENTDNNGGSGYSFITPGGPVISAVAISAADSNSATIVWNTDRAANSFVVYATDLNNLRNGTNTTQVGSASMVSGPQFQHQVILSGLTPATTYYFYVKSTDEISGYESVDKNAGNYYNFNTTNDANPPVITNVGTPIITPDSASIFWQTNELATSQVEYGLSSSSLSNSTVQDSTKSIYHTVSLTGLSNETTYYYRVKSADTNGNLSTSDIYSFNTNAVAVRIVSVGGGGGSVELDRVPPVISNIQIRDPGSFNAAITFNTNEDTTAFVNFSEGETYDKTIGFSEYKTSHTINLFGLKMGSKYNFFVRAQDRGGNIASSEVKSFTTKYISELLDNLVKLENVEQFQSQIENLIETNLPSLAPPIITDLEVKEIKADSAEIYWKTNVKTFGSIAVSEDESYDSAKPDDYKQEISDTQEKTKTHKVVLSGLKGGTPYNFQARSFVLPGVIGRTPNKTFVTLAEKLKTQAAKVTNNSFSLTWETPTDTSSFVEYRNTRTGESGQLGTEERSKAHLVEVKNLSPNSVYSVKVFGKDARGTLTEGEPITIATRQDSAPPAISGISINSAFMPYRANQLQTVVSWKTDEPSTSLVEYEEGLGSGDKLASKFAQTELVSQHIVVLPGFKPNTVYRIRITSVDEAGNIAVTPLRTIITPGSNDSVFEVIIKNFEDAFGFMKNLGD